MDFQSFRMRSLRLRVTCHGNKNMCFRELTAQCFNFQRLRSKASPIHPSFRFDPCARFFHTFPFSKGETLISSTCTPQSAFRNPQFGPGLSVTICGYYPDLIIDRVNSLDRFQNPLRSCFAFLVFHHPSQSNLARFFNMNGDRSHRAIC